MVRTALEFDRLLVEVRDSGPGIAPEIRSRSGAPIVGAATTSINQSFPSHLDYNKDLVGAGLLDFIDVYNFHWYGEQLEKLSFGGIADFLNGTGKTVWCTESGERGSVMRGTSFQRSTTT